MLNIILPILSAFLLTVIFTPAFIKYFRDKKEGQMIREEGPTWHEKKAGTPTMGGFIFNIVIIVVTILFGALTKIGLTPKLLIITFILLLYGCLGMWDDSIKLLKRQNEGLKAWQKLAGQIIGAILFVLVFMHEKLPFSVLVLGHEFKLGLILYTIFAIFWLVGFSNAVNLTDGLDGLVAGQSAIAFGTYAIIAYHQNQMDVVLFCITVIGAVLGFLVFNHKPAKVFMGDMGSLALGGALASVSLMTHHEFALLVIGFVFVMETASVMLQVASFKLTGKRIFKMSPIHHHFEMLGWSEWKIDITFWTIGIIGSIIALFVIL